MTAQKILHLPTAYEIEQAKVSSRTLSKYANADRVKLSIKSSTNEVDEMILPGSVMQLLLDVLAEISQGNTVSLIPHHQEVSIQEAASLLNVSRSFLVGLLEENKIPHRKVGTRRKLLLADVLAYRERTQQQRDKALDELALLSQQEGMGY